MHKTILDLTQIIDKDIPDWRGSCGFQMKQVMDYVDGARVQALEMPNGIGTHMDAPSHFINGGIHIADIGIEQLICPGVVIDVSDKADEYYALSVDDVSEFEAKHDVIPEGSIVIAHTGWSSRWSNATHYRNEDTEGVMRFPTISAEAAELLLKRNINGIAVDTLSPDSSDSGFPVHHKLLGAGKFIIENIAIVDELPAVGFTVIALPIKIKFATEASCRVVVIIEK